MCPAAPLGEGVGRWVNYYYMKYASGVCASSREACVYRVCVCVRSNGWVYADVFIAKVTVNI